MIEILLVRHGQTEWNIQKKVMGDLPIPLNRVGRLQARDLSKKLKGIPLTACYTSPVKRALETAAIILKGRSVPLIKEPCVAEIDYGEWQGRSFREIPHEPQFVTYFTRPSRSLPPKGESMRQVQRRTIAFIERLRRRHKEGRLLVVSHADVIKAMIVNYLGLPLEELHRIRIDNGSMSLLWFDGKLERVLSINSHNHIETYFGQELSIPKKIRQKAFAVKRARH